MAHIRLVDLLRYKKEVKLDTGTEKSSVWVRIVGDSDLQEAYKLGRIASAKIRRELKNPESLEYQDKIMMIDDANREDCINSIVISMERQFEQEADANVVRPDLPDLEEFSTDADAPTLEEQEQLDTATVKSEEEYELAKAEYVESRKNVLRAELEGLSDSDLIKRTKEERINTIALTTFLVEVTSEKAWRSVYVDKACLEREFADRAMWDETAEVIKNKIYLEYNDLEINGSDIKN